MRRFVWPLLFVVAPACSDGGGSVTSPSGGITVYRLSDFRGDAQAFERDVTNLALVVGPCGEIVLTGFTESGDWQNCIESIRVSPGWSVTVYSENGFRGASRTFSSDVPNVSLVSGPCNGTWQACISSFRVRP